MDPERLQAELARALRARFGTDEGEAHANVLLPWLRIGWPFPERSPVATLPPPRRAVEAAADAVRASFPDRARPLLRALTRIGHAAALAEAVTWESITTSRTDTSPRTLVRVHSDRVRWSNPELGFHQASPQERAAIFSTIVEERAASLARRRVRLRAATLDGGRILLTRLASNGTAHLPLSAFWIELTTLTGAVGGSSGNVLVSWLPPTDVPPVNEAIARGEGAHAWSDESPTRLRLGPWRPGWLPLLRPVEDADLAVFHDHAIDPEANAVLGYSGREPAPRDAFLEKWARIRRDAGVIVRTILAEDGSVAGYVSCFVRAGEPAAASGDDGQAFRRLREVAYWIGREHWGKGLATRALDELLDLVAERPLFARCSKTNAASRRVLEKCGFAIAGEDRFTPVPGGSAVEEWVWKLD